MVIKKQLYFLFLVFVTNAVSAQEIIQPYDFPIKPGSESWQSLKTHKEMVQVCQIPDDTLQKMTTRALLQTCLSYPMLLDVLAFNNLITGFEQTLNRFNGYHVLVARPDFAESLVNYYQSIDAASVDTMASEVMQGYFSIKLSITELFFGTQHFIKNGNAIDYKDLLKLLLGKLNTKNNYLDIYGKLGKISSAYAMIHVLSIIAPNEVDENAEFLNFKTQLLLTDKAILNEIILMTKTFIQ